MLFSLTSLIIISNCMKKYIVFIIVFILSSCNFIIPESLLVKIINKHTNIPLDGKTFCQTENEAKTEGGRLCYHVYPYPQITASTIIVAYAVKLNKNGKIKEIYIALTKNSDNENLYLGGAFNPIDSSKIQLDNNKKYKLELQYLEDQKNKKDSKVINYFTPQIYNNAKIIENKYFTHDYDLIDNAIRKAKEQTDWNLKRDNFLSSKLSTIVNHETNTVFNQSKSHIMAIAILPLGKIDNFGNLLDPDKNINFKNFKSPGYNDIDVVYLFPLSKMNLEYSEDQPIEIYTLPQSYQSIIKAVVFDILDITLKNYNGNSLQKIIVKLNKKNIKIDQNNLVDPENIQKIFNESSKNDKSHKK